MNHCLCCGAETQNNKYCSRTCAIKVNNRLAPKRKRVVSRRIDCGIEYFRRDWPRRRCQKCTEIWLSRRGFAAFEALGLKTLGGLKDAAIASGMHLSCRWSEVREHCRRVNVPRGKKCVCCEYDKHVECCHIVALSRLPPETLVRDANAPSNVLILCPNCHWELDHGFLQPPRLDSNQRPAA